LRSKLPPKAPARLLAMDARDLKLPDASYDQALVFFLLHEQPREWREHMLAEIIRVDTPKDTAVAEAFVACTRERRMIWYPVFNRQPAEPTISKVHLHIAA
jgi:ubiquinone/menaquinone biosynthesis C-methylase UbiE